MANITTVQALDMISKATRQYIDESKLSIDYNKLLNKPDLNTVVTKDDVTQATDQELTDMLIRVFK